MEIIKSHPRPAEHRTKCFKTPLDDSYALKSVLNYWVYVLYHHGKTLMFLHSVLCLATTVNNRRC